MLRSLNEVGCYGLASCFVLLPFVLVLAEEAQELKLVSLLCLSLACPSHRLSCFGRRSAFAATRDHVHL